MLQCARDTRSASRPARRPCARKSQARFCAWLRFEWTWSDSDNRNADHQQMEGQCEGEIGHDADRLRDQIVADAADRNRRRTAISATLQRNAIINRPREDGAVQDDRTEIAIGKVMSDLPQFL